MKRSLIIWAYAFITVTFLHCMEKDKAHRFQNQACAFYLDSICKTFVYKDVTVSPAFPGGEAAWQRFLIQNFRYPEESSDSDLQSTATASFIVDTSGTISCLKILGKEVGVELSSFEKEYLRVLMNTPKWTPGRCESKTVPVKILKRLNVHLEQE